MRKKERVKEIERASTAEKRGSESMSQLAYYHSGITVVTRKARERERGRKREKEREIFSFSLSLFFFERRGVTISRPALTRLRR